MAVLYFRNTTFEKLTPLPERSCVHADDRPGKGKGTSRLRRAGKAPGSRGGGYGLGASGVVDDSTRLRASGGLLLHATWSAATGHLLQGQASELNVDSDVVGAQK